MDIYMTTNLVRDRDSIDILVNFFKSDKTVTLTQFEHPNQS